MDVYSAHCFLRKDGKIIFEGERERERLLVAIDADETSILFLISINAICLSHTFMQSSVLLLRTLSLRLQNHYSIIPDSNYLFFREFHLEYLNFYRPSTIHINYTQTKVHVC